MRKPWSHIQPTLFPWMHEDRDPITEKLKQLTHILNDLDLEAVVRTPVRGPGAPLSDCTAIARAFVAKAVLNLPTTTARRERLQIDRSRRRICGWERRTDVPSESAFSRAFAEFAQDGAAKRLCTRRWSPAGLATASSATSPATPPRSGPANAR